MNKRGDVIAGCERGSCPKASLSFEMRLTAAFCKSRDPCFHTPVSTQGILGVCETCEQPQVPVVVVTH